MPWWGELKNYNFQWYLLNSTARLPTIKVENVKLKDFKYPSSLMVVLLFMIDTTTKFCILKSKQADNVNSICAITTIHIVDKVLILSNLTVYIVDTVLSDLVVHMVNGTWRSLRLYTSLSDLVAVNMSLAWWSDVWNCLVHSPLIYSNFIKNVSFHQPCIFWVEGWCSIKYSEIRAGNVSFKWWRKRI